MDAKPASKTRTFGWIFLVIIGGLLTFGGFASTLIAYISSNNLGSDFHIDQLRDADTSLVVAAQGRRGTAASWAVSYGLMLCFVASTAFRRGERWAWWSILVTVGVGSLLVFLRVPLIHTQLGVPTSLSLLVAVFIGLLVPVKDFFHG